MIGVFIVRDIIKMEGIVNKVNESDILLKKR
jgi:hypothetical protein